MLSNLNPLIIRTLVTINNLYGRGTLIATDKFPLGDQFFVQRDFQFGSDIRIGRFEHLGDGRIRIHFLDHRKVLDLKYGPHHGKITLNPAQGIPLP